MILPMIYIPSCLIAFRVPNGVHKRLILILACAASFFANLCVGPSQILNLPQTVWMMVIGELLHGLVDPFLLIPALPEMIASVTPHFPKESTGQINDKACGLFNMFLGIGQVAGPIYGSLVTANIGF